jgi:hypothetical protein
MKPWLLILRSASQKRVSKDVARERDPRKRLGLVVRDASLRDAPHHEGQKQTTLSPYPTNPDAEFTRGPYRMSGVSSSTVFAPTYTMVVSSSFLITLIALAAPAWPATDVP